MPRQVRIEFPGAIYHVMCRGDRREEIFRDDGDREMMLATLAETVGKTGWQVHAWVWMTNHYHLLVETPEANLVRGMTCRGNGVGVHFLTLDATEFLPTGDAWLGASALNILAHFIM